MPSARYVQRPYVPEVYDSPNLVRLAELARASGYTQAERARTQGAQSAQGWARLGDLVVNALQGIQGDKAQKAALAQRQAEQEAAMRQRQEEQAANAQYRADALAAQTQAAQAAQQEKAFTRTKTMAEAIQPGIVGGEALEIAKAYPPTAARVQIRDGVPVLMRTDEQALKAQTEARLSAPPETKPRMYEVTVPGPNGPIKRLATEQEMQAGIPQYERPRQPSAASPDGVGGIALSPDAIEEAAHRVRLFGPASIPTRFNEGDKKRILNRSAEINKSIGQTPAAAAMRAAVQKADQGALNQITKQAASAESFENKALQQSELVKDLSSKVDRTAIPIINGALVSGKAALGNTNAHLLANALLTYTSEYAKIIEGSTGSAAGSSDAARRAAAELISTALSKGTLKATVDQMNREMGMTRTGYRTTIDDITGRMGGAAAPSAPAVTEEWVRDAKGNLVPKKGGG